MGWNSWYIWTDRVTDKIMREAADVMITSGMADHGYQYVNIDDCWAMRPGARTRTLAASPATPRAISIANRRFPDMKAMIDYIHAAGLKAGIYTSPGPWTCGGFVGSYQHEAQDARRFAEWGFDFLKYDWCSYGGVAGGKRPGRPEETLPAHVRRELKKQDRDIVLNLCQYGMGDVWKWGATVGNSAGGPPATWASPAKASRRPCSATDWTSTPNAQLHKFGGPGGWNDPDYLLLGSGGRSALHAQRAVHPRTLWSLVAAPLFFGGDMMRLDDFTLNLL